MQYTSVSALFTAICNSIRTKLGSALPIAHQDIPASIDAIVVSEGGSDVSGVTAAAGDVLSPKVFVNSLGAEVTGTISSKGAATYTPSESAQEIAAGQYLSGKQTISAIPSKYKDMTGTDAAAEDLLYGKKAGNTTGQITGTMPNKGAVSGQITTKAGVCTVPKGYHSGSGSVAIASAEQDKIISGNIKLGVTILGVDGSLDASGIDTSDATAVVGDILTSKTAYVNGNKLTGTMPNIGAQTTDISAKATTVVPTAGYHNGSGVIKIATAEQDKIITGNIKSGVTILGVAGATNVVDTSSGTANEAQLLIGNKAWVDGEELTGTMSNIGAQFATISTKAGTVTPTQGYHNGLGSISIHTDEQAKIIAGNIKSGVTLLGVTGSLSEGINTSDATAIASEILNTKTAYVNGVKVTGTMTNKGAVLGYISTKAGTYTIQSGYHSGAGSVSISSTEQAKIIAGNIKSGVTILGQAGNSNVVDSSSGDATAEDIKSGKKAWVKGVEITGTNVGENWIGTLSFSGTYSSSTYIVQGSSGLFVDPLTGIAIIVIKSANHATYKHVNIQVSSMPSGVTMTDKTFTSDGYINLVLYTARFSGITGKIDVSINCPSVSSGIIQANVTMTYV